jgi:hypothetical protein
MLMTPVLPCPERRRQIPSQFSWIDQRLVRHHYFERAPSDAWALYLFLVTVADTQGLSYYSERTLCRHLRCEGERLSQARQALADLQLIAYRAPLYQVLALPNDPPGIAALRPHTRPDALHARQQLQQLRQHLRGQQP